MLSYFGHEETQKWNSHSMSVCFAKIITTFEEIFKINLTFKKL